MDGTHYLFVAVGLLLIVMALSVTVLKRLPLTTSILYLGVGLLLGPLVAGLISIDAVEQAEFLERFTEIVVIISLFSAGLKLRLPFSDRAWWLPVRLAFLAMAITVGLITLAGVYLLQLPVGLAVLLGAVLAPTDPVLASDVQAEDPWDTDRLRFSLTGEAGLNDGTAFPFVMLGLGLLGLHDLGDSAWRWFAVDLVWAVVAGLAVGGLLGTLVARLILYMRRAHKEAVGTDDFLALGLIALSYGGALLIHAYGFLAVFAAGAALRRIERRHTFAPVEEIRELAKVGKDHEVATHEEKAPAYMAQAVLGFTEQLERIGEVAVVVLVGAVITARYLPSEALWFVPLLLLVIRPAATTAGLLGCRIAAAQKMLIGWFGIRGIGSIYYLMYAIDQGLPRPAAETLTGLTLATVAVSVVVHGISVTPLMERYMLRRQASQGSRRMRG
jgi:NhaP-type Na+/H+ or K+/H+ antiporter